MRIPRAEHTMVRLFLIAAGVVSLGTGIAGVFIPLLPATPFLLLAAACFARSSPRLYQWLIRHPVLGRHILSYRRYRAIGARTRLGALLALWGTIGYAVVAVTESWWIRIALVLIAVGVSAHLLWLKTLTREMSAQLRAETAALHRKPSPPEIG